MAKKKHPGSKGRRASGDQSDTLKRLIRDARRDGAARSQLAAALTPLCAAWLRQLFPESHEREDATQQVVLHILARLGDCDLRKSPLPWLRALTRNRGLDIARRLWSRRARFVPWSDHIDRAGEPALMHSDERRVIHEALDRLTAADRELILGRLVEEKPLRELAQDRAISTVHRRIEVLRERLKSELARPLGFDIG